MPFVKRFIFFAAVSCLLCSCGYTKLAFSKLKAKLHPTPQNLRTSSPEKCLLVTGKVVGNIGKGVPLAVLAVTNWEKEASVVGYAFIPAPGPYYLFLPEGRYQLLVFADLNGDSVIEKNELIGRSGNSASLTIGQWMATKGNVAVEDIAVDPAVPRSSEVPVSLEIPETKNAVLSKRVPPGVITTLDDERFEDENGSAGIYQPVAYFERVNGFFYMLEEYDPGKIPVIFVHGSGGTPRDWRTVVEGLDRKRFQPWFFYYPSGLRIETVAGIFHDLFLSGRVVRTDGMVIVAHSQGGLVVREAMNLSEAREGENVPQLFISICTPFGGVDMAATAVAHSPVIVPSWIDLASGSDFINALHRRSLPKGMCFELFFAYGNSHILKLGPNGDETVSLRSQLDPRAQKESLHIRGFNDTHSDILRNREVLEEFSSILAGTR